MLPVFAALAILFLLSAMYISPVSVFGFAAALLQAGIVFLAASSIGNWLSIYFPMLLVPSGGKPMTVNYKTVFAQMIAMVFGPLAILPGALGLGLEILLDSFFQIRFVPIYFVLSMSEFALALFLYFKVIDSQSQHLYARETNILATLTVNAE